MKINKTVYLLACAFTSQTSSCVRESVITAEVNGSTANIKIVDYIGDYDNTGSSMRKLVDDLLAQGVRSADVYVNSQGGSVFDASEIVNQLQRINKVSIRVGALAASAATYLVAKFPTRAAPNSQFMIHKPSLWANGNETEIQSQLKMLQNLTADYKTAYSKKTKLSEDEIEALWSQGDYWMNATEALEKGFIDEIESDDAVIDDYDIALLRACSAPKIPEKPHINTQNKMDKLKLIASLGLAADATDEQIEARLAELKNKEAQLSAVEAISKSKAKALVDKAIQDKRIEESERASYESFAVANYEAAEKLIGGTPPLQKPTASTSLPGKGGADVRANWTLADYLDNDPKALAELETTDPEKFKALNDAYYAK